MKKKTVRIGLDLPRDQHRRLREEAARKGCSMKQVIVDAMERLILPTQAK
jgi:hypothetical protein